MILSVTLVVILIVAVIGGVFFLITRSITASIIAFLICIAISIVLPITAENILKADKETFNENLNEYVVVADKEVTQCREDGSCFYSFKCHHWVETIHHPAVPPKCTKTSSGTSCSGGSPAYDSYVDHWHECPYTTTETNLSLQTSQGAIISLGDHRLPDNPETHRYTEFGFVPSAWEDDNTITTQMEQEAGVGIPVEFSQPQQALQQGHSWPVVVRHSYINYIEADRSSLLNWDSTHVGDYLKKKLLPKINSQLHNYYYMDRAFFIGVTPQAGVTAWEKSLQNFDSALGTLRQGDLYFVAVDADKIANINEYGNTLMAYWTDPAYQSQNTLSKNGIVIVVTIKGNVIQDAVAYTMVKGSNNTKSGQDGNTGMLTSIEDTLVGKSLDPTVILGSPVGKIANGKVTVQPSTSQGVIEQIAIWGSEHFVRAHMTDKHPDSGGGFTYLEVDIQPSADDIRNWDFWCIGLSLLVFCVTGLILFFSSSSREYKSSYSRLY